MKISPAVSLANSVRCFGFILVAISSGFAAVDRAAPGVPAFPLVDGGHAAVIVLAASAPEVVRIAAADFAADVERVTGVRPEIVTTAPVDPRPRLIVATEPSPILVGKWEAFQLSAVPASGKTPATLTVDGSDRRALAYGLYELSRRIGVSPWYWWADVPVVRQEQLSLTFGTEPIDQPAVKYRGIFLNDEDWGLQPWAAKTFEPEVGNLGPKTYAKIFELMLRLRANTLWPAMHACTKPFHLIPGNAAAADAYAIILGSSHAEPMLRNNVREWTAPKDTYNYLKNRDGVLAYWEHRVKERTQGESLFTLGMRGIHDSPIVGPKTQAERITTVEKVFADQRALLARNLGKGDGTTPIGQLFCPYKEVLDDYEAGLRVPNDVTLLWPDDNFGYVRRFGTPAEQARIGGQGVYYHASYLGAPLSWIWIDTLPPALIWTEMMKAYEHGARTVWIVNVGDLKSTERSAEFFLDLAWHADRTSPDAAGQFIKTTAARDFGPANAAVIASIIARNQSVAFARKPEHLQWNLPKTPYAPTALNESEIVTRLDAYAKLVKDTEAVAGQLTAGAQDAFFELVGYPVQAAAAANERYFRAELARLQQARGDRAAAATFAVSALAGRHIGELTARYNDQIAGGKWRYIMTAEGLPTSTWKRFQPDPLQPLTAPSPNAMANAVPKATPSSSRPPADARPGDFFESAGVVSIEAGHFTSQTDIPNGGWRSISGLGRTGSAVTVLPSTATITARAAPRLGYRFHVTTSAPATIHVRLLPTYPINPGSGLRFGLAIDDSPVIPFALTTGFDNKSDQWEHRVLSNATEVADALATPLAVGWHTLHLLAVDPGVVVDKLVIDLGGLQPSYDGPPETRKP